MAFLGFLSINRVLFGCDCLQVPLFKDLAGLSSNLLSFLIVRKDFKACAYLNEDSVSVLYVGFVSFKFI